MGLPKEPRQKMINMMYLVLTALLALNVSSEVLNAFKTVNNSIRTSNKLIDDKNQGIYKMFADEVEDQQTKNKAMIWSPLAARAGKLSDGVCSYIDTLEAQLEKESGQYKDDSGKTQFNADNLDAATRMMIEQKKGTILYDTLSHFKDNLLDILRKANWPAELDTSKLFHTQLARDIASLEKSIPINMKVPQSNTGEKHPDNAKGWSESYFHMTPSIAAATILSKFKNDVKNAEAQMVDYCHTQVGKVKVVYDQFDAIAQSNTTYAMPGDPIEITAGVGAFSKAAAPTIYIDGQKQTLTDAGTALYKTTASGVGQKTVDVRIVYTKPDGTTIPVDKKVNYTVGVPSGASVFLEKMNVLYIGVDNPLTISGGSVGAEKVHVSFPGGSIDRVKGDEYVAKPKTQGMGKIIVDANGKKFEFPMRMKLLPNPTGFVGTKKGGTLGSAEFKAMGGVIARLEDSDFEAPFKVVSYTVGAVGGPISLYSQYNNNGNRWTGQAASLVSRMGPGTTVFIDHIRVVGPDGREREISPMKFDLK